MSFQPVPKSHLAFVVVHTSNRVTGWISQMVIRGPPFLLMCSVSSSKKPLTRTYGGLVSSRRLCNVDSVYWGASRGSKVPFIVSRPQLVIERHIEHFFLIAKLAVARGATLVAIAIIPDLEPAFCRERVATALIATPNAVEVFQGVPPICLRRPHNSG